MSQTYLVLRALFKPFVYLIGGYILGYVIGTVLGLIVLWSKQP